MEKKNKKLIVAIIILIILLVISASALTGTLLYNYFVHREQITVDAPGNIITPEGKNSTDPSTNTSDISSTDKSASSQTSSADEPSEPADSMQSESTGSNSISVAKSNAISLHTKQPEENKPFQVTNMFPGDTEKKYYRVKVAYKGDVILRYHADIRPGYEKLAEVLKVRIRLLGEDRLLYDGLMRDMPESLNKALYTTEKTESELYYEITAYLDTSVGNEYQDKELIADFRWWVEETDNLYIPQTGDVLNIYLCICIASVSLLFLLILLAKRRKEETDEH